MVVRPAKHEDRALLDALEQDSERGVQLVADADGRLQGFATLYAGFDTLIADRILVMNDLYARLDWVTAADNRDARRFYVRHGGQRGPWVSYSLVPSSGRRGG
jgi:hypothetical protein